MLTLDRATELIAPPQLAEAVLVEADGHSVMVILPTARHLRLGELSHQFGRNSGMATERTVARLFQDCAPSAANVWRQTWQ
jgi:prolyl-tRNA editing enzyme YbaK/EbsC (Cys-tRNA(Pro) deacylase)